ncbi:MAG: chemotaxis protein CheB [Planctomycetes bacterium]|nr:chemotaxis protein CheB [Planctomycetota bacterium]
MSAAPQRRDVVVIGGSAGALEALQRLVAALPADLPAAVFVVLHLSPSHRTHLPEILGRAGPLPVELAVHGAPVTPGRIVVAPPDNHLMLRPGQVAVVRGPKENGHRPAVDPLFRSAAAAYGRRVTAVILSGALDCGTAGLMVVRARGGLTLVQRPDDAQVPSMPHSALKHVQVDHVGSAGDLGAYLARAVADPLPAEEEGAVSGERVPGEPPAEGAPLADVVCPLCQGVMTEAREGDFVLMRCHVGHAFSLDGLLQTQFESLEAALWAGARALEESARVARRAARARREPALEERAATLEEQAATIRRMLLAPGWGPTTR